MQVVIAQVSLYCFFGLKKRHCCFFYFSVCYLFAGHLPHSLHELGSESRGLLFRPLPSDYGRGQGVWGQDTIVSSFDTLTLGVSYNTL